MQSWPRPFETFMSSGRVREKARIQQEEDATSAYHRRNRENKGLLRARRPGSLGTQKVSVEILGPASTLIAVIQFLF